MPGFIIQPQTLFSAGPLRQFGGKSTPSPLANVPVIGKIISEAQLLITNPASGSGSRPTFKGYVTITENAIDALEITKQPVQQGAPITDHAFKKPVQFSCQILFNSTLTQSLATIYQNLLKLQSSFIPFNCITPKRTYYNMLFASLGQTTDKQKENILSVNCTFEQIITVPVGVTSVPASQLSNPGLNAGVMGAGTKQLQSALSSANEGLGNLLGGGSLGR